MREAVIVTAVRSAIGKSFTGSLKDTRPDDLMAMLFAEALRRTPGLAAADVEDVVVGCAFPEGEQGLNIARIASLRAGLPTSVPAFTVNRFCASGLQAIALAAERVVAGGADVVLAGGVESLTRTPFTGHTPLLNPTLVETMPKVYMAMGLTAEEVARRYGVSREEQDAFALRSQERAAAAQDAGRFRDEIVPLEVEVVTLVDGRPRVEKRRFDTDEGVRKDTTLEGLARLKPAFQQGGTVTAGNSSQVSDGAAAVVVMSAERARALSLRPRAIFRSFAVAGVDPEVMGIGPVKAVPKALEKAGLTLDQVDLIELNEAFAAQAVPVVRELGMDVARVNVNGGAIALGHPLGCTGVRQTVTLIHEAERRGSRYGLVTMCIGGGMGAAGIFEFPQGGK